jgi:hypothetical protein
VEAWNTHEQAQTAVCAYIEVCSNRQRCHAAHGYLAPLLDEQTWKTNEIFCLEKCWHIIAEGLAALAEARAAVAQTGDGRQWEGEIYRLTGDLLLQQAVPDEHQAETCLHQALDIARRQQAKSWELRAAMSLSRLWQRQGKRAAARELLTSIYGWFTEGFDTADLQEAKTLLYKLAWSG